MEQINIRFSEIDHRIIEILAKEKGISVTEFVRQSVFKDIFPERTNIAFRLLQEGKIGRKNAFILSGLSYHEFLMEFTKRSIKLDIPDEVIDYQMSLIDRIDFKQYLK